MCVCMCVCVCADLRNHEAGEDPAIVNLLLCVYSASVYTQPNAAVGLVRPVNQLSYALVCVCVCTGRRAQCCSRSRSSPVTSVETGTLSTRLHTCGCHTVWRQCGSGDAGVLEVMADWRRTVAYRHRHAWRHRAVHAD